MANRRLEERRAGFQRYKRDVKERGKPFYPFAMFHDTVMSLVVVADPRPDWYFLGYFAILALIPPATESIVIVGLPVFAFVFLFLVPLLWPDGERHWSRRPAAIAAVALPFIAYAALTVAGLESPWVPKLEGAALPATVTSGLGGAAQRGADLFVTKSCIACHAIESAGGRRGPELSRVGSRMTRDRITARIANGGNGMPSYAGSLTPSELADLVAFLETRR